MSPEKNNQLKTIFFTGIPSFLSKLVIAQYQFMEGRWIPVAAYMISYDLISPGQKYNDVQEAIKFFGSWAKILESTWLIKTYLSAEQVYNRVHEAMDSNDHLLVIEVKDNYYGHLDNEVHKWIKKILLI